MRIDYEDIELYSNIHHRVLCEMMENHYLRNLEYYHEVDESSEWFYKTSPYYLYDILKSRDIGLYEIFYDYIKRRVDRRSTIFNFGAGIGTLEVLLLKRYPAALTAEEFNLLCMDFIHWRVHRRGAALTPRLDHYNYVVSIDTLQRLPSEEMKSTLAWLLSLGDRCFIYINEDIRHPLFNKVPFDVEEYLSSRVKSVKNFHGLWNIEMDVILDE